MSKLDIISPFVLLFHSVVEEPDLTLDDQAYYEATVGAITILAKFVDQLNNTDSVQLHRVRKTTQSDANTTPSQSDTERGASIQHNGAETGASNQQVGQSVEQDGGEIPVFEPASTHIECSLEYIPESEQNFVAGQLVSLGVLLHEGGKIKGEVIEQTVEERGDGVSSEEAMDVGKQEEYVEEDVEMGDIT